MDHDMFAAVRILAAHMIDERRASVKITREAMDAVDDADIVLHWDGADQSVTVDVEFPERSPS